SAVGNTAGQSRRVVQVPHPVVPRVPGGLGALPGAGRVDAWHVRASYGATRIPYAAAMAAVAAWSEPGEREHHVHQRLEVYSVGRGHGRHLPHAADGYRRIRAAGRESQP